MALLTQIMWSSTINMQSAWEESNQVTSKLLDLELCAKNPEANWKLHVTIFVFLLQYSLLEKVEAVDVLWFKCMLKSVMLQKTIINNQCSNKILSIPSKTHFVFKNPKRFQKLLIRAPSPQSQKQFSYQFQGTNHGAVRLQSLVLAQNNI